MMSYVTNIERDNEVWFSYVIDSLPLMLFVLKRDVKLQLTN